jgi:hypothetical protein
MKKLNDTELTALCVCCICGQELDRNEDQYLFINLTSKKKQDQWVAMTMKKLAGTCKGITICPEVRNGFWISKKIHDQAMELYRSNEKINSNVSAALRH